MPCGRSTVVTADSAHRCADIGAYLPLLEAARSTLAAAEHARHTQCIVLLTACGNVYAQVIADALSAEHAEEAHLLDRLRADGDTFAAKLVCMWHEGSVDAPSYAFRQMLTALDAANAEAEMLLNGSDGYVVRKIHEFR